MTAKENFEIKTKSAEETISCGVRLARFLKAGDIVALKGNLGSGKTTFVRGLVKGCNGGDGGEVTSPTFVLMHEYRGSRLVYHMDSYRLKNAEDARAAGLEEFFYTDGIVAVEWAERIEALIPSPTLVAEFRVLGDQERSISFGGERGFIQSIRQELQP